MASAGSSAAAGFPALTVEFNPAGWGPTDKNVPSQFAKLPFMAFQRSERLGKAADFGGYLKPGARGRFARGGGEENADLAVRFDDADRDFALVDTSKAPKRSMGFKQNRPQRQGPGGQQPPGARGWEDKAPTQGRKGMGSSFNKKYNRLNKARYNSMTRPGMGPTRIRDPSVKIAQDWLQLDSFDLQQLKELSANVPTEVHDLRWTGSLEAYDEEFDRITSKKPKTLRRFDNIDSLFVKTSDDPVIEELATEDAGNVFGTDAVIAHIMACTRSALPWDIVATYVAGSIFLDVRDEFEFELHTVNETSNNAPPEGDADAINGHEQLSFEATACHHNFTQQVLCKSNGKAGEAPLKGEPKTAENPLWDPAEAEEGHEPASLAFRYRSFKLGPGTTVVARTVVHAVSRRNKVTLLPKEAAALGVTERPAYLSCFTLLEYDPKASNTTPWTQIIESQRGNVIATEIKNNAFKLGKAAASAMLAGADFIKLGFLSRPTKSDPDTHAILGISSVPPSQFAQQLGMSTSNAWGILKWFVELVRKHAKNLQEDTPDEEYTAKFVLLRDPNKGAVHLYNVPPETFEGGAEDGAGSDEEGGEGAGWAQDEGAEEA